MLRLARLLPLLLLSPLACSSSAVEIPEPESQPVRSVFVVPSAAGELVEERFFDHPWPSDVRRTADGSVDFTGWPNPTLSKLLISYIDATRGLLQGFSPMAAAYLRFDGDLDPSSLPSSAPDGLRDDASVQLIDVDPRSPERGKRALVQLHWRAAKGAYWPAHTLAVMPALGAPLRPNTRYALLATRKLRAKDGHPVERSADLQEVLAAPTERTRAVHEAFAPALAEVVAANVAADDLVHFTTFTTNDPTAELFAVADHLQQHTEAPALKNLRAARSPQAYRVFEGVYGPSPNYQAGKLPFAQVGDGGQFAFEAGQPVVQSTFDPRFALAVPHAERCPLPSAGYPVVLYAHGTGGDYRSFLDDGTASLLTERCLSVMGVDQIFHGERPGAPAANDPNAETTIQTLFFNFVNPTAARTNGRQSALDVVQQARLVTEGALRVSAELGDGQEIRFDPNGVTFFGHSQGGLNGPLFLASSPLAHGGVLSGAGAVLAVSLLEKTEPVNIPALMRLLLGLSGEFAQELNVFHPFLTLAQSLVDSVDPIHYARALIREPRQGFAPKSLYQTEGVRADGSGDTFTPPRCMEAFSVAIGLPRIAPGIRSIPEAGWLGLADVQVPSAGLTGNLAGGRATGALAQFVPPEPTDGHFVIFYVPEAKAQAAGFLQSLSQGAPGTLLP